MFQRLSRLFNRSPQEGDRKDHPMPDPTPQPPAAPATPPINLSSQVEAQIGALADAMRQLAESQKTLVEAMKPAPSTPPPTPQTPPPPATISGDPAGGVPPGALASIDYSKLSPLQQITLGLRDARPAPRVPASGAD